MGRVPPRSPAQSAPLSSGCHQDHLLVAASSTKRGLRGALDYLGKIAAGRCPVASATHPFSAFYLFLLVFDRKYMYSIGFARISIDVH